MSAIFTDTFSFVSGAVRFNDLAYIAMCGDEMNALQMAHTFFSEWDKGDWRNGGKELWQLQACASPARRCSKFAMGA